VVATIKRRIQRQEERIEAFFDSIGPKAKSAERVAMSALAAQS